MHSISLHSNVWDLKFCRAVLAFDASSVRWLTSLKIIDKIRKIEGSEEKLEAKEAFEKEKSDLKSSNEETEDIVF